MGINKKHIVPKPRKPLVAKKKRKGVFSLEVPSEQKIEVIFPEFFVKAFCFDPSKPVELQTNQGAAQMKRRFGRAFGNTQSIVNGFRGLTLEEVNKRMNKIDAKIRKLMPTLRAAKKVALRERPGTKAYQTAADKYTELTVEYGKLAHRQEVARFLIANAVLKAFFPRWKPALKEAVLSKLPRALDLSEPAHYQHLANNIVDRARNELTKKYRKLVAGQTQKSVERTIANMALSKAERVLARLEQYGDKRIPKTDWAKIRKIITGSRH